VVGSVVNSLTGSVVSSEVGSVGVEGRRPMGP